MFKTEYETLLEQLTQQGKIHTLTEKESSAILSDIYSGYDDFITGQRKNEKESEHELREIVLNA